MTDDYQRAMALLFSHLVLEGGELRFFTIGGVPTASWRSDDPNEHSLEEVSGTSFPACTVGLCVELGIWGDMEEEQVPDRSW